MAYTKIFTINCHGVVASLVRNSTTITTISGTENEAISGNNLNMSNYITATACTPAYSASGLPTGLTINSSTGVISGTPTSSATGNITITVSATGLQSVTFTVPYSIGAASSSGSSSGGGSGYIVSGTGWPAYDGTYVDSGTTNNGQPVYIYGNYALWMYHFYYIMVGAEVDAWVISTADKVTSVDSGHPTMDLNCKFYGEVSSSTVTPDNVSYWNDGSNIVNISVTPTGGGETSSSSSSGGNSSSSSSEGGAFVWGTTQSFTISGSSTSTINTTYTWNSNNSRYESTGGYYVTYEDWSANNQVSIRISDMTEYYIMGTGGDIAGTKTWTNIMTGVEETLTVTVGGSSGDSSSGSSSGGLPTEPIGTEKLVISGGGGMVWSTYNGDYVIVAGTSSSTDSIWYNSSNGYYILYVDGYWRVDSDGVAPFDASIDTRLSPSDWDGVSDTSYNLTFTYSSGGSSGGSFVWGTTQSFTISGSGSSAINTTYTWNTQSYAYKANNNDYWVTYMAGPDQASITYNQSMTEYYIDGTGGDISGTKTWTNLMSGGSETLTVTVIS